MHIGFIMYGLPESIDLELKRIMQFHDGELREMRFFDFITKQELAKDFIDWLQVPPHSQMEKITNHIIIKRMCNMLGYERTKEQDKWIKNRLLGFGLRYYKRPNVCVLGFRKDLIKIKHNKDEPPTEFL